MKNIILVFLSMLLFSCTQKEEKSNASEFDGLVVSYVRLGLTIGQYDPDFVDAYYGPDSLRPTASPMTTIPKDSLLQATAELLTKFQAIASTEKSDTLRNRANWISGQLIAFGRRIQIVTGTYGTFDEESKDLFGVVAPTYTEAQFKEWVARLDSLLPGKGDLPARFQQLSNRFVIPKEKLDTVFRAAIAECRRRTSEHISFPAEEDFTLEYVTDKPWSGYNWYKGNYKSVIQINTDLPILIDRAIDVGSHESYPGHHVYNMLLEKNLYHDRGFLEVSLYPLFSPQSLIAEGSANYGIEVVMPDAEKITFTRDVLLPLAGLDTTGIGAYYRAQELKGKLTYVTNEVGRGLINKTMSEEEAVRWLINYGLYRDLAARKSLSFIERNRSYIINYNYGMDLVKSAIEAKGGTSSAPDKRWELFEWLLSNEITPAELIAK
jgi:hypothetical protein